MAYQYGLTIKTYRRRPGITQAQLAENWKADGGVLTHYVQEVERGAKRVTDIATLRHIAKYLNIPLWEFELSEYNPFTGQFETIGETTLVDSSLDLAQELIKTTWHARYNTSFTQQLEEAMQTATREDKTHR
jgi:transcriptional regulator with XRE-family HTH domain